MEQKYNKHSSLKKDRVRDEQARLSNHNNIRYDPVTNLPHRKARPQTDKYPCTTGGRTLEAHIDK